MTPCAKIRHFTPNMRGGGVPWLYMPDSRSHRGAHPEDARDFAPGAVPVLRVAAGELSFLLGRGYAVDASLKLVGDHHQLTARQRKAVARGACPDETQRARKGRHSTMAQLCGRALAIDGFNCLITVEAMLSGAPLFRGRDGALRDLASVHGSYRAVAETEAAAAALTGLLARVAPSHVQILLDRPVGNSGRTRDLLETSCASAQLEAEVALHDHVDRALVSGGRVVASSDAWLLDHAAGWVDLPMALLDTQPTSPWLIDLRDEAAL